MGGGKGKGGQRSVGRARGQHSAVQVLRSRQGRETAGFACAAQPRETPGDPQSDVTPLGWALSSGRLLGPC